MKRLVIFLGIAMHIGAGLQAPLVSLAEKNRQADTAFLAWRVTAPHAELSARLTTILTPEARAFIVEHAQLPLDRVVPKKELLEKVQEVSVAFRQKYPVTDGVYDLERIIREVIVPEYVLQRDLTPTSDEDRTYNQFLETLSAYRTKPGTWLDIWALRYLTSEAQLVALSVIERATYGGKSFNQLTPPEQIRLLESAAEIVVRQFMQNLEAARSQFKFTIPPYANVAIKHRVLAFLREKFGL